MCERARDRVPGCVEALAEERALLLALWAVHRPPSPTARMLALRLLHALAATPAAAWASAAHAGALFLLAALLPPPAAATAAERVRCATHPCANQHMSTNGASNVFLHVGPFRHTLCSGVCLRHSC